MKTVYHKRWKEKGKKGQIDNKNKRNENINIYL